MKTPNKVNNYFIVLLTLIAVFAVPQLMAGHDNDRIAYPHAGKLVDVQVVNDYGRRFKKYPINSGQYSVKRAYLEAKDGKSYGIRVKNNTRQRIGLVIAVDGRNIISGKKSKLKAKERMYILNPYQAATYDGWRSGKNRINEFYFTDVPDSYSDQTFGDRSAMGVIAVAVFKEKNGRWYREPDYDDYAYKGRGDSGSRKQSPSGSAQKRAPQSKGGYQSEALDELGTGYGDNRYSPSRRVHFKAEKYAAVKHFIKYERKATLCEMGISRCGYNKRERNRFWSGSYGNYGFVPPPPNSRYRHYGQGIQ
ncbi:MAG: hypothetical protein HKN88_02430 [Gammaproteobacteria bacterium]|nr:hypothetical protein [Gammaproteobacteria bacterium]NNC96909.1 hypothetical protein [Gammaproteobacteria bacterium]NNM13324.1 hypothetical protein [Gammaproteobacteria bacterium]